MLILISPEKNTSNELAMLHDFFAMGLSCFHLRKPSMELEEYRKYIEAIDPKYHDRIVIHTHHTLVKDFALKGIHFREEDRIKYIDDPSNYFMGLPMYGKTISSSFHALETLENCSFEFDYHFLSPVFSSISKEGYPGKGFEVHNSSKTIIGLGGADRDNFEEFEVLGYTGVAFLGGIWNSKTPRDTFKFIFSAFTKRDYTY